MKYLLLACAGLLTTCSMFVVPQTSRAQTLDLGALQRQLGASPAGQQAQQAMVQQAMQYLASNPQMLTSMVNSLTPEQQASLTQQALVAGQKIFTPAEQTKLTQFVTSPEGAGIAQKMPQLIQQMTPVVMQMYAANQSGATLKPAAGK